LTPSGATRHLPRPHPASPIFREIQRKMGEVAEGRRGLGWYNPFTLPKPGDFCIGQIMDKQTGNFAPSIESQPSTNFSRILCWSVPVVTIQLPAAYVTASAAKQSPATCGGLLRPRTPRNDIENARNAPDQDNFSRIHEYRPANSSIRGPFVDGFGQAACLPFP